MRKQKIALVVVMLMFFGIMFLLKKEKKQDTNKDNDLQSFVINEKRLEFGEKQEELEIDPITLLKVELMDKELTIDDLLRGEVYTLKDDEELLKKYFSDTELQKRALKFIGFDEHGTDNYNGFMKIAIMELMSGGLFTDKNVKPSEVRRNVMKNCIGSNFRPRQNEFSPNAHLDHVNSCFLLHSRPRGTPYGISDEYPLQVDFKEPIPASNREAYWVKKMLAYHASSQEEYEKWISLGKGSLYETYEKLFGWPNYFFEQGVDQKLGQRVLLKKVPVPIKMQEIKSEKLSYEEILKLSKRLFPQASEGVVRFFYRGNGLSAFSPRRLYKISRYTRFLEPEIQKNLKYNILSSIALMERRKKMMFGDKEINYEQWGYVFIKEMENIKQSLTENCFSNCNEFKRNENQKENLKIFLNYLEGNDLKEVILPSTLEEEVDNLFFYSNGREGYEIYSIQGSLDASNIVSD